jgi:hypothetical protein
MNLQSPFVVEMQSPIGIECMPKSFERESEAHELEDGDICIHIYSCAIGLAFGGGMIETCRCGEVFALGIEVGDKIVQR